MPANAQKQNIWSSFHRPTGNRPVQSTPNIQFYFWFERLDGTAGQRQHKGGFQQFVQERTKQYYAPHDTIGPLCSGSPQVNIWTYICSGLSNIILIEKPIKRILPLFMLSSRIPPPIIELIRSYLVSFHSRLIFDVFTTLVKMDLRSWLSLDDGSDDAMISWNARHILDECNDLVEIGEILEKPAVMEKKRESDPSYLSHLNKQMIIESYVIRLVSPIESTFLRNHLQIAATLLNNFTVPSVA